VQSGISSGAAVWCPMVDTAELRPSPTAAQAHVRRPRHRAASLRGAIRVPHSRYATSAERNSGSSTEHQSTRQAWARSKFRRTRSPRGGTTSTWRRRGRDECRTARPGGAPSLYRLGSSRGAEAPLLHRISYGVLDTWLVSAATSAATSRREQRDGNNGGDDQHDHDPGSRSVKDSVLFHIC